MYIFF